MQKCWKNSQLSLFVPLSRNPTVNGAGLSLSTAHKHFHGSPLWTWLQWMWVAKIRSLALTSAMCASHEVKDKSIIIWTGVLSQYSIYCQTPSVRALRDFWPLFHDYSWWFPLACGVWVHERLYGPFNLYFIRHVLLKYVKTFIEMNSKSHVLQIRRPWVSNTYDVLLMLFTLKLQSFLGDFEG